jgi:hypothetical protein
MSFIHLGDFKIEDLNINIDDALNFSLRNYRSKSQSKRYLEISKFMDNKIQNELGFDLTKLMDEHESKMDQLEDQYN